jgi:hypothetical protein
LHLLSKCGSNAFQHFYEALVSSNQVHLADLLTKYLKLDNIKLPNDEYDIIKVAAKKHIQLKCAEFFEQSNTLFDHMRGIKEDHVSVMLNVMAMNKRKLGQSRLYPTEVKYNDKVFIKNIMQTRLTATKSNKILIEVA